jgi:NADPH:quinone reductase-like Zn-dependent oxidoreductase
MKAWIIREAGGPEQFELREIPRPEPEAGRVLIEVRAFGLNRSEYFTRIGDSPSVSFRACPSGEFEPGQTVVAMMGGMGRVFDGSYAQFTSVPVSNVFAIDTHLEFEQLGALPEMLQTTHGSLFTGLRAQAGETLLIRGGTSSIGLMTMAIAKANGLRVATTSRDEGKRQMLLDRGADEVFIDDGRLAAQVREAHPDGVDRLLELIGTKTLLDSLQCVRAGGTVCMTGILGGEWELSAFRPMEQIPTGVCLTSYSGGASDITAERLQSYVRLVESGELVVPRGPTWRFEQLVEAHRAMDANESNGKMVVSVEGPTRSPT